jgi:hypothetical protein
VTTDPIRISSRAELVDALAVACELEHGLSLQYLFAAFSLRKDPDEGLGDDLELVAVRKWAANIFFVAAQEMLHLAQASNLLLAVGGAPHLARPNFPQLPGTYPPDLGWELTAFSGPTLARFIAYERPDPDPGSAAGSEPQPGDPIVPSRLRHASIGQMYAAIEQAFTDLAIPKRELFIGNPNDQLPGSLVNFPQLVEVVDRESAKRATLLIIDQGEGTRRDSADSHYGIFSAINTELNDMQRANPDFQPARTVADNPLCELHTFIGSDPDGPVVNIISDPTTRSVQDLFTVAYDVLVLALFRNFAGGRDDKGASVLKQVTLGLMMTVIRPLGELLTRLPMGPGYVGLTAGPSFEYFPEIELVPHAAAARTAMAERLGDAAEAAAVLARSQALDPGKAGVIASVGGNLARFAAALRG